MNACSTTVQRNTTRTLLLAVLDTVFLVHARPVVGRIATERDLKRSKELVHTSQEGLRPVDDQAWLVDGLINPNVTDTHGVAVAATAG